MDRARACSSSVEFNSTTCKIHECLEKTYADALIVSFLINLKKVLTLAKRYKNTGTPPTKIAAGTRPRYCWLSKRVDIIGDIDRGGCCDTLCSGTETTLKPGWPGKKLLTTTIKIMTIIQNSKINYIIIHDITKCTVSSISIVTCYLPAGLATA